MIKIYSIICKETSHRYIGKTEKFKVRIDRHIRDLNKGLHHNVNLQKAWGEFGEDAFDIKVECVFSSHKDAAAMEESLIREGVLLGNCFNIGLQSVGGDNLTNNPNRNEIIKRISKGVSLSMAKMSASERKKKWGRAGIENPMYGKNHSDESKRKISDHHAGNKYALGSTRSKACKKILSDRAKARVGEKNPFFGKSHSDEAKAKIAAAHIGKKPSNIKKVIIDGVEYESATLASNKLDISLATISYRSRSKNFENYQYV